MPKNTMHADTPFAKWLFDWLDVRRMTAEKLAEDMGNSGAMISKWINGQSVPDAKNVMRLSEVTGETHWHLAHLAWGWPAVPQTDDLLKDDDTIQMVRTFESIKEHAPELADDLLDLGKTLHRKARARRKNGQT